MMKTGLISPAILMQYQHVMDWGIDSGSWHTCILACICL